MTRVHLPSGRTVTLPGPVAAKANQWADFCPQREEHTTPMNSKRYEAIVHPPCGLAVVWVPKRSKRCTR